MPRITPLPFLASALLALAAATPAGAQRAAPPIWTLTAAAPGPAPAAYELALPQSGHPPDGAAMALGGIVGGAAGFLGGGLLGYGVETGLAGCGGDEWCGVRGILLGAAVGEVMMLPLGVHLANGSRGSYAGGVAASVLAGLGGLVVAAGMGEAVPATALLIPAAQILASVAVEKSTARKKQRMIDRPGEMP